MEVKLDPKSTLMEFANDDFVIETDLTDEERQIIAKSMEDYDNGVPFVSLEEIKRKRPPKYT